jgi:hypothetical protein
MALGEVSSGGDEQPWALLDLPSESPRIALKEANATTVVKSIKQCILR